MVAKYDKQYQDYMGEVQSYLKQVKNGRRVPAADPTDPRFSQQADDERQARRAGLGNQIRYGPPTPVWQPPQISQQRQMPPPGGPPAPAANSIMDWLDQKRGQLTKLGSNRAAAPSPVWGFHEPTLNAAEGMGKAIAGMGDVMSDPRNAWMGLGPMAAVSRPAGWGAEVLRRYKLRGGTPETLNRTLTNRAMDPGLREGTVQAYKQATDIAAPPSMRLAPSGWAHQSREGMMPQDAQRQLSWFDHPQRDRMDQAGDLYEQFGSNRGFEFAPRNHVDPGNIKPTMESASSGNAAYGAVSRQVGRMLDSPSFGLGKPSKYGPEPVLSRDDLVTPEDYRRFARERGRNLPE